MNETTLVTVMSDLKNCLVDVAAVARVICNSTYTDNQGVPQITIRESELKPYKKVLIDQCKNSKAEVTRMHDTNPDVFTVKVQALRGAVNDTIDEKMGDPEYCGLLIGDIEKIRYYAEQKAYSGIQDIVSSYKDNPAAMAKIKRECAEALEGSGVVFEKADEEIGADFLEGAFDSAIYLIDRTERFAYLLGSSGPDDIRRVGALPGQDPREYVNLLAELEAYIANVEQFTD